MPSQEAAELIPLSWAVAITYEELVATKGDAQASRRETLELLALGISQDAPIYDARPALNDLRVKISELPTAVRTVVALKAGLQERPSRMARRFIPPGQNRLLTALPAELHQQLLSRMEKVSLMPQQVPTCPSPMSGSRSAAWLRS